MAIADKEGLAINAATPARLSMTTMLSRLPFSVPPCAFDLPPQNP
jgi:hypothetical protein